MPRKDRSYTDRDVIRIVRNNLTQAEVGMVLLELCRGVKIEVFDGEAILVPISVEEESIEESSIIEDLLGLFVFRDVDAVIEVIQSIFD